MFKTVGSSTTYYLYDGDALIAEVDASTDQVTRSYTWGAMALAAAPSMVSLAPAATQFLNPTTVATLATLAAEDAENPAAEEETIEQDGNNCLEAVVEELQNAEKRITVSR